MRTRPSVQFVPPQDAEILQRRVVWMPNSGSRQHHRRRGHMFKRLILSVLCLISAAVLLLWLIR